MTDESEIACEVQLPNGSYHRWANGRTSGEPCQCGTRRYVQRERIQRVWVCEEIEATDQQQPGEGAE